MRVEIRDIITKSVILDVFNVVDITEGICDMVLIQSTSDNILYKPVNNQVLVIIKQKDIE